MTNEAINDLAKIQEGTGALADTLEVADPSYAAAVRMLREAAGQIGSAIAELRAIWGEEE